MSQASDIRLIHIAKSALGMDEETYRAMLSNLCGGKTSSKSLSAYERHQVLRHLKGLGFKVRSKAGKPLASDRADPMVRKLMAMWYALAEAQAVEVPANSDACYAAVEAWALRQLSTHPVTPSALRFTAGEQMSELIEQMKKWGRRVKADID